MDKVEIYEGDCLEIMRGMLADSLTLTKNSTYMNGLRCLVKYINAQKGAPAKT